MASGGHWDLRSPAPWIEQGSAKEWAERVAGWRTAPPRCHGLFPPAGDELRDAVAGEFRELPCEPGQVREYLAKEEAARGAQGLNRRKDIAEHLVGCLRRRANYIVYLKDRIEDEDWHGASDAANDLRELDAEIRTWKGRLEWAPEGP